MSLTVADWLPAIRSHLPRELLSSDGFGRVERLACELPGSCLTVLEIPLWRSSSPPGADLSIRIQRPEEARDLVQRVSEPRLRAFLKQWSDRTSVRRGAPEIWLEFDLRANREFATATLPPPVVCARLAPEAAPDWAVDHLLPAMHGTRVLPELQRKTALDALDALPPPARLLYVFSLRARCPDPDLEPAPVRLEVFGLEADTIAPFLARLAGPEAAAERTAQIQSLLPLVRVADRNHLSFDLAPQLQPRIGIELSFRGLPEQEPGWSSLFERVQALTGTGGEAAKSLRQAVWAWPGWSSFWTDPQTWPVAAGAGYFVRSLSHLKVVTWPRRRPQAKVYLLFGLWRRRPK